MLSNKEIAEASREELIIAFLPMAQAYAQRVYPGDPDAVQDAYLALAYAAETYEADKGSFKAWAGLYLLRTVKRGRSLRDRVISLPARRVTELSEVLLAQENKEPDQNSVSQIAKRAGLTEKQVEEALGLPSTQTWITGIDCEDAKDSLEDAVVVEDHSDSVMDTMDLHDLLTNPILSNFINEWAHPPDDVGETELDAYRRKVEHNIADYLRENDYLED